MDSFVKVFMIRTKLFFESVYSLFYFRFYLTKRCIF